MVNSDDRNPSLGEAAGRFLATLSAGKKGASQPEVYKFARWYGWESPFSKLAAPAVAHHDLHDHQMQQHAGAVRRNQQRHQGR